MESNEQTELTSKMGTNSLIETRMKASDEVKDRGWRDSTKKEKGLRGMDNSVVIAGGRGV